MNDNTYIITDYCTISNYKVVRSGKLLFKSEEKHPAAFYTAIYKYFSIDYPKFYKMDNLCKLGFLTSELLLRDKNIIESYGPDGTGIVLYNAASSIDADRNHQQSINNRSSYFPSPSVFVYTLANIVIGEICIRHKLFGEGNFFIEEKFNSRRLYSYVKQLFDEKIVRCCITGWLESDGENYHGILYWIEKSVSSSDGIAIFNPDKLNSIYLR